MTPEGRIKSKFSRGLKGLQVKYPGMLMIRMPVPHGRGLPWLDYVICANGQYILVEAKRDENHEPTPQQKATIREGKSAGAVVLLVYNDPTIQAALCHIETKLNETK